MSGTLFVVATPIGNLEDITARALRVLRESAVIAAEDTRRTAHLLARYAITTPSTSLHEHNEDRKAASLIARLERGDHVALVSDAGTPTISDPGQRLIQAAIRAGIRVESIPGPNAAVAALAVSGFPAESFLFLGFPPIKSKDRAFWFQRALHTAGTIVFYEAPHRIRETLADFQRAVGDCEVAICRELTKAHEDLIRGRISDVLESPFPARGEFTVVANIGHVTNHAPIAELSDSQALSEFSHMTENDGLTRRAAVSKLAKRHNVPANQVYASIERAKKSII